PPSLVLTLSLHDALPISGLLRAKPIGEVSISELCAAAGVGRASFYRNFDSKEAVLQRQDEALLRRWQRDYDTAKARALAEGRERSEEHTSELQSRFELVC